MNIHKQERKINFNVLLALYTKINSKWIIDLNVKPKSLNLLKEKIRENMFFLGLGKNFLDMRLRVISKVKY